MRGQFWCWLFVFCFVREALASGPILVDETWGAAQTHGSVLGASDSLKTTKKMGIGTTLAGATGLFGLNLEINFTSDLAFSMGAGVSRGFQSFNMNIKKTLGGDSWLPYFVGGYSRWFSSEQEGGVEQTAPSVLAKKFLSAREKQSGRFSENILYPGLGLQYLNRSGEWLGLAFFIEVLFLVDIDDLATGATGGIGSVYYF